MLNKQLSIEDILRDIIDELKLASAERKELLEEVKYISSEMRYEKMAREAMYKDTERLRVIIERDYTVKKILNDIKRSVNE